MALFYVAPTPELAVELEEVRADAAALAEVFSQLNSPLPKEFPRDAVIELAGALHKLPSGTARGCLRPLNEAQSQLATIRSQYIRHDYPEESWDIDRPPLFRGEPIDQRLRSLMSSVSTALQTANRLAAEEPELEEPEAGLEPPDDAPTVNLIERSSKAQKELESEREELDSLHIRTEPAETLSRRLTDAVVLNQLGRGELRLPRIVSARLRRIASALRDYPVLLQKAAELVTAGTNLADYAHEKWIALESRIFHAGTTTIREVADDISNYARRLEANRKANEIQATKPDFDLQEAVRRIHAGLALPAHWREQIVDLPLGNRRLRSLAPLAGLVNLRAFRKPSVRVSDISPLADLVSLESLNLNQTQVSDLSSLSALTNLRWLNLDGTPISDLRPLSSLLKLQRLGLSYTKVSDLSPLAKLSNLEALRAMHTAVSDIEPLTRLPKLKHLDLDGTEVAELPPMIELSELETLELRMAKTLIQIRGLNGLAKLRKLYLGRTGVLDIEPLSNLARLESLDLNSTQVSDLGPLTTLSKLNFLDLSDTHVTDLTPISGLPRLQSLLLSRSSVTNLGPLAGMHLRTISIAGTKITDLAPLVELPNLVYLAIDESLEGKVPKQLTQGKATIHVVRAKPSTQ